MKNSNQENKRTRKHSRVATKKEMDEMYQALKDNLVIGDWFEPDKPTSLKIETKKDIQK